jgi:hypothetical protein
MSQKPEPNLAKPIKLPEKIVKAFAKQFEPLEQKSAGLPTRLLDYLLNGKNPEVLRELSTIYDAGEVMVLRACKVNHFEDWPLEKCGFFKKRWAPLEFYFRLSRIWEEASQIRASREVLAGLPHEGRWLVPFLWEFQNRSHNRWSRETPLTAVTSEDIEQLFIWRGQPPEWLVRSGLYIAENQRRYRVVRGTASYYEGIPNMGAAYVRHKATVVEALQQKDHIAREETMELLGKFEETLEPYADVWADCAVRSAKGMREKALTLIARIPAPVLPHLQKKALEGNGSERIFAIEALAKIYGESVRAFLEQTLKREKTKLGKECIQSTLSNLRPTTSNKSSKPAPGASLSPIVPLDEGAKEALRKCLRRYGEETQRSIAAQQGAAPTPLPGAVAKLLPPSTFQPPKRRISFTEEEIDQVIRLMETYTLSNREEFKIFTPRLYWRRDEGIGEMLYRFAAYPTLQFIHVIRWTVFMAGERDNPEVLWINAHNEEQVRAYHKRGGVIPNLKEQAEIYRSMGYDDRDYAMTYLHKYGPSFRPLVFQIPMEAALVYFRENLDTIEEVLNIQVTSDIPQRRYLIEHKREMALTVLDAMAEVPEQFISTLWEIALNGKKKERPLARKILNKLPDKEAKLLEALGKGKSDQRISAAEWLGDLKDAMLVPKLKKALAVEKHTTTRAALQLAIEKMGGTKADSGLAGEVNVKALEADMEKLVAKGRPLSLSWLKFDKLPKLTWKKTGKAVSAVILEGLIIQSFRAKNPEPGPELVRIAEAMHAGQREKLSEFIFKAWIEDDGRERYTDTSARQELSRLYYAERKKQQNNPRWDDAKFHREMYKQLAEKCEESSSASKGVFALIGACNAGSIAVPVYRYIKKWFGRRLHQGKALVQMLAHVDDVRAIQSLLALGYRFRTKGIRELAAEKCLLIAAKKGWTVDELADRTIPSAGFDDDGKMEFDYGKRKFVAKLLPTFEIRLEDEKGGEIDKLPDARKDEDEEYVKEAKMDLGQSRKDLKSIVKMQRERLYEAMCTQRTWSWLDWEEYLLKHPLAGIFCQRLVWQVVKGPNKGTIFRPLADRTLTDVDDEAVKLDKEDQLALAHDITAPKKAATAWVAHLGDYKVEPLFEQFGKPGVTLSAEDKEKTEWTEFLGHMSTAFTLAKVASARGYHRGPLIEGNFFCEYRKRIAGLKLEVCLEFTGEVLEEEKVDSPIAMKRLLFFYQDGSPMNFTDEVMKMGKVPPVLFHECWNDLRAAALAGGGFDPEREKKTSH